MSHPNPSHEKSNEYPEDKVTHYPSSHESALRKALKAGKANHKKYKGKGMYKGV